MQHCSLQHAKGSTVLCRHEMRTLYLHAAEDPSACHESYCLHLLQHGSVAAHQQTHHTTLFFLQQCSSAQSSATSLAAPASSFRAAKPAVPQRPTTCAVVSRSAGYCHTAVQSCHTIPAALQQARLHSISQYRQLCCYNRCIIAPCRQYMSWRKSVHGSLQAPNSSCVCSATAAHKQHSL